MANPNKDIIGVITHIEDKEYLRRLAGTEELSKFVCGLIADGLKARGLSPAPHNLVYAPALQEWEQPGYVKSHPKRISGAQQRKRKRERELQQEQGM